MKRTFLTGDEWLFYKVYCGSRFSDKILKELYENLTTKLLDLDLIDKWFFIRFNDPENHIRIRFHIMDIEQISKVISLFRTFTKPFIENKIIWKIETGTYFREIERYGSKTISLMEEIFYHDSVMLCKALSFAEDEELFALFIMKSIDKTLEDFGLFLDSKLRVLEKGNFAFQNEFKTDIIFKKSLRKKYEKLKLKINKVMQNPIELTGLSYLDDILKTKSDNCSVSYQNILELNSSDELEVNLDNLVLDQIHMSVNRAFRSKQRLYELVCYDFLFTYNKFIKYSK